MNGNSVVLDTNIVLYLLNGDQVLSELLYQRKLHLSFISQFALLGFKGITSKQQSGITRFIKECIVIDINEEIKQEVIALRRVNSLNFRIASFWPLRIFLDCH